MRMAISVEKLLADAQTLVSRLKDHDATANVIIAHTGSLHKRLDAMKQYQDDITELNEIARHRPRSTLVLGIAQENRQIRELQQENRELRLSLEEHQSAMELIMQKYREQILKLVQSNQWENELVSRSDVSPETGKLLDKICEMAAVMQTAVAMDDDGALRDQERITQLELENKGLREMLEVCAQQRILHQAEDDENKSEIETKDMTEETEKSEKS